MNTHGLPLGRYASEFGECSEDCGPGKMHKRVFCISDGGPVSPDQCPEDLKPFDEDDCDNNCTMAAEGSGDNATEVEAWLESPPDFVFRLLRENVSTMRIGGSLGKMAAERERREKNWQRRRRELPGGGGRRRRDRERREKDLEKKKVLKKGRWIMEMAVGAVMVPLLTVRMAATLPRRR